MPNAERVYYKVLNVKGRSCHGGTLRWSLPTWDGTHWTPGDWMPAIENPEACVRGYHACAGERQLLEWLHERIWVIESQSAWLDAGDKVVTAGPVRLTAGTAWDDYTARLYAISCALDVLPLFAAEYPDDSGPSDALVVAWRHAHGHATDKELAAAWASAWASARASARAAAWDSAWASAWASASAAAWDSAKAAQAARLARYLTGEVDV